LRLLPPFCSEFISIDATSGSTAFAFEGRREFALLPTVPCTDASGIAASTLSPSSLPTGRVGELAPLFRLRGLLAEAEFLLEGEFLVLFLGEEFLLVFLGALFVVLFLAALLLFLGEEFLGAFAVSGTWSLSILLPSPPISTRTNHIVAIAF